MLPSFEKPSTIHKLRKDSGSKLKRIRNTQMKNNHSIPPRQSPSIQLMEEDGIVLNEESARDLIEDTADQAEKPGIGKKIGSLFRPKYDKDDKLILREEHFMG